MSNERERATVVYVESVGRLKAVQAEHYSRGDTVLRDEIRAGGVQAWTLRYIDATGDVRAAVEPGTVFRSVEAAHAWAERAGMRVVTEDEARLAAPERAPNHRERRAKARRETRTEADMADRYDTVKLRLPRGYKHRLDALCAAEGQSASKLVATWIDGAERELRALR